MLDVFLCAQLKGWSAQECNWQFRNSVERTIPLKKQVNPTIKAHLIRSAFYVLLLVAVCTIPFALAQRNTIKRGVFNPAIKSKTATKLAAAGSARGAAAATKLTGGHRKAAPHDPRFSSTDARSGPNLPRVSQAPRKTSGAGPTCSTYNFISGTDPIVPGDTDTGNHVDDGGTFVALPLSFQLYDQTFNGVNVNSNG